MQRVKLCLTSGGAGDVTTLSAFLKGILPSDLARMPFFLGLQMAIHDRHTTTAPGGYGPEIELSRNMTTG